MNTFATHAYAVVRVKVIGTNFSDNPKTIAEKVSEAVWADSDAWFIPKLGSIDIEPHGSFKIECVEFADEVSSVLVDEIDPHTQEIVKEHLFDEGRSILNTITEVTALLSQHPEANQGNSKIHYALMRLQAISQRKS